MMWRVLSLSLLLLCGGEALPTTTAASSTSCTKDELYTSLSRNGTEFCKSVVDNHCASTPAAFTSYDVGQIWSHCGCVLTDYPPASSTGTGNGGSAYSTRTDGSVVPVPTDEASSKIQSTSSGGGSVSAPSTTPPGSAISTGVLPSSGSINGTTLPTTVVSGSSSKSGGLNGTSTGYSTASDSAFGSAAASNPASSQNQSMTPMTGAPWATNATSLALPTLSEPSSWPGMISMSFNSTLSATLSPSPPSGSVQASNTVPPGASSIRPSGQISASAGMSSLSRGSGIWNSSATAAATMTGPGGTVTTTSIPPTNSTRMSTGIPGASAGMSSLSQGTGIWNSSAATATTMTGPGGKVTTLPMSPTGAITTGIPGSARPFTSASASVSGSRGSSILSGAQQSGSWNSTLTRQASNISPSGSGVGPIPTGLPAPPSPSGMAGSTSRTGTRLTGFWNSTAAGGTASGQGSLVTGPTLRSTSSAAASGQVPRPSQSPGPWNATNTINQSTRASGLISILPTGIPTSTRPRNNTQGRPFTPSSSAAPVTNITTTGGVVVPTVPSISIVPTFPGWNASLPTSVWPGSGTIGTGASRGTGLPPIPSANGTIIPPIPIPTSIAPGTGTGRPAPSFPTRNTTGISGTGLSTPVFSGTGTAIPRPSSRVSNFTISGSAAPTSFTPGTGTVGPRPSFPSSNTTAISGTVLSTPVFPGTGTGSPGPSFPTGNTTRISGTVLSTPVFPGTGTASPRPSFPSGNFTGTANTALPTVGPGTGTAGTRTNQASGNFTFAPSTLQSTSTGVGANTSIAASIPGSLTSITGSATTQLIPSNITAVTTPTPTPITTTGSLNSSSSVLPTGNVTTPSATTISAANFTEVYRTAAAAQETCYHLPRDPEGEPCRRALLRNSKLREENVTIPVPYIESIEFESEGVRPLYLTVRDRAQETYFLDISNRSRLAIVDADGNSMLLDGQGVHFATNGCHYDVNVTITDMFAQLADLSDANCSFGNSSPPAPALLKRAEDIQFDQTLFLEDQCGNPIDRFIRDYPVLRVGDTACQDVAVNEASGRWEFDCKFPGSHSGTLQCQDAVRNDIVDFLLRDPIGGECPDLSTVISTLANTSSDVLNGESLRTELNKNSTADEEDPDLDTAVDAYEALWAALQEFFVPAGGPNATTPWEEYISTYETHRDLVNDICEGIHTEEIPLNLNLRAGATYIDAITTLNWAPRSAHAYNITIQDPSTIACCDNGSVVEDDEEGTCAYPESAFIGDTGCICGRTVSGQSLAFEATECDNFDGTCEVDEDCETSGFVCLTGSCCGAGVCVDPYACSQNGTALVTFGDEG